MHTYEFRIGIWKANYVVNIYGMIFEIIIFLVNNQHQ